MKHYFAHLLMLGFIISMTSCTVQLDRSLLRPTSSPLNPKLPLSLDYENIEVKNEYRNSKLTLNRVEELTSEELRNNFLLKTNNYLGVIKPNIYAHISGAGYGFSFLLGLSLGSSGIIGIPWSGYKVYVSSEFEIQDLKSNTLWRKSYEKTSKVYAGFYYNSIDQNGRDNTTLKLLKETLSELKKDIQLEFIDKIDSLQKVKEVSTNDKEPDYEKINWKASGTGFFISNDGYLATNYHVISESSSIEIEVISGDRKGVYKAEVEVTDPNNDIAILKIIDKEFVNFDSIPYFLKRESVDVGTSVFSLGYPLAMLGMGKEVKFTDGRISSKSGFNNDIRTYQTTTAIQPGSSGGPLFDFNGNLVGINTSGVRKDLVDNVSYSIKTNYLFNLIEVLPNDVILPCCNNLKDKNLVEQIKILSDYVILIKVK